MQNRCTTLKAKALYFADATEFAVDRATQLARSHGNNPMESQSPTFDHLITSVDRCIQDATEAHLPETVALLRMAKLDLVARANGISEGELELFLFALESDQRLANHMAPPELQERLRTAVGGGNS
jgi:hypothetical protein